MGIPRTLLLQAALCLALALGLGAAVLSPSAARGQTPSGVAPVIDARDETGGPSSYTVDLRDQHGAPVEHAVLALLPLAGPVALAQGAPRPKAVMDQRRKQFEPHVLAVQAGTAVSFPNSDDIRHHVYSFSPAKTFELKLYKGIPSDPVIFDTAGTVALGCNIHDRMVGYIYVLPTPYFATSGPSGRVELLGVPAGRYQIQVWHPRLPPPGVREPSRIKIPPDTRVRGGVRLELLDKEGAGRALSPLEQKFKARGRTEP